MPPWLRTRYRLHWAQIPTGRFGCRHPCAGCGDSSQPLDGSLAEAPTPLSTALTTLGRLRVTCYPSRTRMTLCKARTHTIRPATHYASSPACQPCSKASPDYESAFLPITLTPMPAPLRVRRLSWLPNCWGRRMKSTGRALPKREPLLSSSRPARAVTCMRTT